MSIKPAAAQLKTVEITDPPEQPKLKEGEVCSLPKLGMVPFISTLKLSQHFSQIAIDYMCLSASFEGNFQAEML